VWEEMMNEKEKARKGFLYDANNEPSLMEERTQAKDLCHAYNQCSPSNSVDRKSIIETLIGESSQSFLIEQPFWCDYGYNISFGENFYVNHNCVILDGAKVTFGDNVFIAPNCSFYTAGHPLDVEQRNQGLEYAYPITIGNNVWFGGNVVVLPGVTIGDNAVIGAGSVVNRDISSGVIAAGNPCRVIRKITDEDRKKYWKKDNEQLLKSF